MYLLQWHGTAGITGRIIWEGIWKAEREEKHGLASGLSRRRKSERGKASQEMAPLTLNSYVSSSPLILGAAVREMHDGQ